MSPASFGVILCLSFITLEAFQAVYFGAVFQNADSFLVGACVFGISVVGSVVATAIFQAADLVAAARSWKIVIALNLFAALSWSAYFIAVQLIEPAVVFTVFSGMVPLGTVVAKRLGVPEASSALRRLVHIGYTLILLSILLLAAITVFGLSGFVRGGWLVALAGVALSAISGGLTAFVILYSVRLNRRGVGPLAQFGLRFALYTLLSFAAFLLGIDDKGGSLPIDDLARVVLIGLAVIAFPLYLLQKAIPLIHSSAIAAITALGPVIVFLMQLFEGRVDYSTATLIGLAVYMIGAFLAVSGARQSAVVSPQRPTDLP